MGRIIWTNHLQERIVQRGLTVAEVEQTIRFPDKVKNSQVPGTQKQYKVINGKTVGVAVRKLGNDWVIATAWRDNFAIKTKDKTWFLEKLIYSFISFLEKLFSSSHKR